MATQQMVIETQIGIEATIGILPPPPSHETLTELIVVNPSPQNGRPAVFSNTFQECLFVLTTTMAVGQDAIFQGAMICITSFIGRDLGMNAAELTWILAGQNLAAGCFLLLWGRVADLFGRRLIFLTAMLGFTVCLLIMGFATNPFYMDIICGLCGVFSAMAVPPAIGKLGAVYPTPSTRKNRAFACFSAGNPIGFALGAFISGITMSFSTWRAAIWVICFLYAIFSVVAFYTVPQDVEQKTGGFNRSTLAQFDFLGAVLIVVGIASFTAALTLSGSAPQGWKTNYVIAMLVIGIVLIATFVYWQSIYKHPLMPLWVWRDRNFTLLVSSLCLGASGLSGNDFWITLYWQRVQNNTPITVAVKLLPMMIGGVAINVVAAVIMHRVSNKLIMITGAVCFVVSNILFSTAKSDSSYWDYYFMALLLSVVGADFEYTVTNMYVMSSLPSEQQSVAGGLFNTATRLAATIQIGIQTSVYNSLGGSSFGDGAKLYKPYQSTFWVSAAAAGLTLFLVPFLTIKKQGVKNE